MVAGGTGVRCEALARGLFEAITQFCLAVPRSRRRPGELKEIEHLALALLRRRAPQTVGDLQRQLGILPAQMSRVVRSLEDRERPLIACRINTSDKRKIDVVLAEDGLRASRAYQGERVAAIAQILSQMSDDDLDDFARLLESFRGRTETLLDERKEQDERASNGTAHA
jgi:DNA-binding MarR family transcriptional regulator